MELPPDPRIAAISLEHGRIDARPEVEALVGWIAEHAVEVGVLDCDRPAGSNSRPHALEEIERTAQVLEEETRVDEVVRLDLAPLVRLDNPELDVVDAASLCVGAGELELQLVHVESSDMTARADEPRELERDRAAAAADVDARHAFA